MSNETELIDRVVLRDSRIDLLKGISICGVVMIHFGGSFITNPFDIGGLVSYVGLSVNQLFTFSVPLFIFLAGWVMRERYHIESLPSFWGRKIWRLSVPYIAVNIAYWYFTPGADYIVTITNENFIYRLLYRGIHPTQYFVSIMIQLIFLFPVIRYIEVFLIKLTGLSFQMVVYVNLTILSILHVLLGLLAFYNTINYFDWFIAFSPFWLIYFYFGMRSSLIMKNWPKVTIKGIEICAFSSAFTVFVFCFFRLVYGLVNGNIINLAYCRPDMMIFSALVVLGVAAKLLVMANVREGFFEWLGRYSYQIYLWHLLVLWELVWSKKDFVDECHRAPVLLVAVSIGCASLIAVVSSFLVWFKQSYYYRNQCLLERVFGSPSISRNYLPKLVKWFFT